MPGPRAAYNLQMPHPRGWKGGQMPRSSPWGGGGEGWAQLELTDWCISTFLQMYLVLIAFYLYVFANITFIRLLVK